MGFGVVMFTDAVSGLVPDLQPLERGSLLQIIITFLKRVFLFVSDQRDQEEVRRRFASISYSDSFNWDRPQAAGNQKKKTKKKT